MKKGRRKESRKVRDGSKGGSLLFAVVVVE